MVIKVCKHYLSWYLHTYSTTWLLHIRRSIVGWLFRLFSGGMFTISALFCKAKRNGNYIVVIKMMMMMLLMVMMTMTMIMITTMKKQITGQGRKNHRKMMKTTTTTTTTTTILKSTKIKSTKYSTWELTFCVPQSVTTE